MYKDISKDLLHFISMCPTAFHAVSSMKTALLYDKFTELKESEPWELKRGGRYVVTRNGSALIAFTLPAHPSAFRIFATHADSPCFKIKENPDLPAENGYVRLNVECYGGLLYSPWLDRPLSAAGRIIVKERDSLVPKLICIRKDLLVIPSLAIHLDRTANAGHALNPQTDLLPLYSNAEGIPFMDTVAGEAGVRKEDILGHDLFVYSRTPGTVWGPSGEFLSSGRLDDLQCAFASFRGFIDGSKEKYICVHCMFDNEETGSCTAQGAASTFLDSTLRRIACALGTDEGGYPAMLARSFMISADNAHAVHPNHPEKSDPVNRPVLNEGIVIKFNASQRYCTDGLSAAMFRDICHEADVPLQVYTNRSDMPGGSTLGNIAMTHTAMPAVDIGLPQLAMHSPWETAGSQDTAYLVRAAAVFFA